MTFPLDANTVRDYMSLNTDATSKYSDTTIGSNIRTAVSMLERKTGRKFGDVTATYHFTSDGQTSLTLPGLRSATAVVKQGATLSADATYFLQPDSQQSGVYTGLAFTGYRPGSYLANPQWFDRGLDFGLDAYRFRGGWSLPNDLSITGSWGYDPASTPDEVLMAVKLLAAYFTKLGDANSAGTLTTPDGNTFDLSSWPIDVQQFVADWSLMGGIAAVALPG